MSDTILIGVLRMPPDCWSGEVLDVMQRHGRYLQAADEIELLQFELHDARRQSKQNGINAAWLIKVVDEIHSNLCPGKSGTWQDRAKQAVVASREIAEEK